MTIEKARRESGKIPFPQKNRIPPDVSHMRQYMHRLAKTIGLACCLLALSQAAAYAQNSEPVFSGKAYAQSRVELRTSGFGKIKEVNVAIGQFVKANATLLSYDGDSKRLMEFKSKLSMAKIYDLEWKKQSILRSLHDDLRQANLYDNYMRKNMGTQSQINNLNMSINSLEIQLDAVNENLANAKDEVRSEQMVVWYNQGIRNATRKDVKLQLRMHAPIEGHILWMNSDFQVGAELKNDVKAFIIGDMSHVKLVCEAYEASLQGIKEGQNVNVKFDSISNKVYRGVVSKAQWSSINAEDKSKPSVFEVDVFIENGNLEIKEGYVGHVYLAN
ncbi:MAG: efflux RND transporter periplasmic adaptor subunit [Desulfovibrionaceae bacterium]|nr:efflux RND transporter periplasmic adaptor subunit [Desulfovibrionaceae bacterium]MBF0512762.1 efflux RND transporter periplasmic adaptor subunit [Desulfovibrionaceae bacterium]